MKKQRRKFSKEFKLKVVLEALQERSILSELGEKYELHPNQISSWKQDFLSKAEHVFSSKTPEKAASEVEAEKAKLYAKIGQLQMEVEFLKKKLFQ
jgi:transposase